MKKFRKTLTISMATAAMALSFAACGDKRGYDSSRSGNHTGSRR